MRPECVIGTLKAMVSVGPSYSFERPAPGFLEPDFGIPLGIILQSIDLKPLILFRFGFQKLNQLLFQSLIF